MKLESRKSYGLWCVYSLLMLTQAALSGWSWGMAIWGVVALVWAFRWYRFDRDARAARPFSRHSKPNRRSHSMPWWAWLWAAAIALLTADDASGEWKTGLPIGGLLDGAMGLWCLVSIRAHFVGSMADRLGRALLPATILASAWLVSTCVVDVRTFTPDPEFSLLVNVVVVIFATSTVTLVIGWPLVLGVRRGMDYWSPNRHPQRSGGPTNRVQRA